MENLQYSRNSTSRKKPLKKKKEFSHYHHLHHTMLIKHPQGNNITFTKMVKHNI